jgi:hypothetical protein
MSLAGVLHSSASTLNYNFGSVSGGATPAGSPPWASATFSNDGLPSDTVQLTLSAGNLSSGAFISCWYFNLNPALDPVGLALAVSGSTGSFTTPTVQTGANGFKAGPDGKFDLLFGFATTGDDLAKFGSGDSVTFTITGISGLTADDFSWFSTSVAGGGTYSSAAHINSGSTDLPGAWVNPTSAQLFNNADTAPRVPDTSTTIALLGVSVVAIELFRRKMRTQSAAR